jgi:diguanylate cyclase (GGDEF)-like protein
MRIEAPPEALEILKARPETAPQFNNKFGYLPEGVDLPEAPPEAIKILAEQPTTAPQFKRKFGYLPAPAEAIDVLRAQPHTQDQFRTKFGYLPDLDPTAGERGEAFLKDASAAVVRMFRAVPTLAIELASRAQGKRIVPAQTTITADGKYVIQPEYVADDYTVIERLLPGGTPPKRGYNVARGVEVPEPEFLPSIAKSAQEVSEKMDGTIAQIKESLPEAVKAARSGPIVTKDDEGKLDVHWENINIDVLSELAAESIAYGGGILKTAKALGGGATAAGSANSLLISAETVHDTRQKIMAKLEEQGIRGPEAEVLANRATERAIQIIAPVAFVTGKFGEGAAINTRNLQQVGKAAGRGAGTEMVEEVVQTATPAIATGEQPKSEELLAAGILAPLSGGVQAGTISAAAAWDAQLKQKLAEGPTEGAEGGSESRPTEGPVAEDRRAEPTEGPRERRGEENAAERERVKNLQQRVAAVQDDIKGGRADETALAPLLDELVKIAYTDDMTGLHNYRAFQDFVKENPNHAVMFLDVDDFKILNTEYGHSGGDQALGEIGQTMRKIGDEMGVIPFRRAKQGAGDEFLAVAANPDLLKTYGNRVQEALESTKLEVTNKKNERVPIGRIGVSYGVDANEDAAEAVSDTDKQARKAAGKRKGVRDTAPANAPTVEAPVGVPAGQSEGGGVEGEQVDAPVPADDQADIGSNGQPISPGDVQPATSQEIAQARPAPSSATVDTTLYGGLPVDRIADAAANAARKAHDALGIPSDGVDVGQPVRAGEPGIGSAFVSPTTLIKKYPKLGKYVGLARKAFETQEGLRNAFRNRLDKVDQLLTGGDSFGRLSDTYKKNKETLAEIRWTEDALGKNLTAKQMKDDFGASPEVIKAHTLVRSAYDHALGMANNVRELRGKQPVNRREGYVPHFFHNFFVIQENPLPEGAAGPPHSEIVGSAKTLAEATAMGNQMVRDGKKGVKIRQKQFKFPGEEVQAAVIGDMDYFRVQRQVEKEMELTPKEAEELLDGIVRRRGRSRFVGNFFQRKGVNGFEKDLEWIDRRYFNMISRYVALDPFKKGTADAYERDFGKFEGDKKGLAKVAKDYINDINGTPTAVEELINSTLDNMPGFKKFLGRYLGDRPALQVAQGTANATALLKLGLYNTATAVVNSSQLIGANALLGGKYFAQGNARAIRAFAGKSSTDKGILKQAGVETDLGLESSSGYSKTSQMGAIFKAGTYFFSTVEKYVRATTVLGAYYKAKAGGVDHKEAIEFAKGVNRRVNFDYSIVDAPNFIRRSGPVGQVLFQFKKYPVKMMEFMASLKGAEHARFWVPIFLLAGYHGFPGFEALKEIIKATFGGLDMELEMKRELTKWADTDPEKKAIAKTIMYGLFSNDPAGGIDISQRIGGGDFIPSRASDLFGPAFSSVVRAAQMAGQENWAEAIRAIAPAPGNLAVALGQDRFSRSPDDRDRPVAETTPADTVKKALGFRPTEEAVQTDVKRIIDYEGERYRKLQAEVIDGIIETGLEYGQTIEAVKEMPANSRPQAMKEAAEKRDAEMADIMETMKDHGLVITEAQVENEIKNKNLTRSQRAFLNASNVIKAKTAKIYRFAQGSDDAKE